MKNKLKLTAILFIIGAACFTLAACEDELSPIDKYVENGYSVVVSYDPSGANFVGKDNTKIFDAYNVSAYEEDGDGNISIKLVEPTERTIINQKISLIKTGYFVAGWYKNREIVRNSAGEVVDDDGNVLIEKNGSYYNSHEEKATPAYTYSDVWDFENDRIIYKVGSGVYEMTLYAGWVKFYEYDYYYLNDSGEWTKYASTSFDYKAAAADGSDKEALWVPRYENGAMVYSHPYSAGGEFVFPKINGTTFDKAYLDEDMTEEITDGYAHIGTLELDTCTPVNRVVNIYVTTLKGDRYRIETADQLCKNVNVNGYYEIMNDLDFTGKSWPLGFSNSTFNGAISSHEGNDYTLSNVTAKYSSNDSEDNYAGLFGALGNAAVIKDVTFENVTFDISSTAPRLRDASFGFFAGDIDDGATVENVRIKGELSFTINGQISIEGDHSIYVFAGGKTDGLTFENDVELSFYGKKVGSKYRFNFDPENVRISENGTVVLNLGSYSKDLETYVATPFGE